MQLIKNRILGIDPGTNVMGYAVIHVEKKEYRILDMGVIKLKSHLESQFTAEMNWDNYGSYWHIDHKVPISFFNYQCYDDHYWENLDHLNYSHYWFK